MTEAEYKAKRGTGLPNGWADLEPWLEVEPCDCGEPFCDGWSTRARHVYTVDAILIGAEPYPCVICGRYRHEHGQAAR
jgi:hypothetical protein